MKTQMPKVDLSKLNLSESDLALVKRFVKTDGSIRASRPPLPKMVVVGKTNYGSDEYDYDNEEGRQAGMAAYIWRWVVFMVSPVQAHHCMPCTDFCYLPREILRDGHSMDNPKLKHLHDVADAVIDSIPPSEWHGVRRWGNAMGVIGKPVVREGGTIVYR